jgi:electron transfer flavoprotein beta subunit
VRIVVLLSVGRHPISGRACPVRVEAQAIGFGLALGEVIGLHAGALDAPVDDYLGYGVDRLGVLGLAPDADPVPALVAELQELRPDLILAGRRGQGGADSGMLPYQIAHALGWPIVADVASLSTEGEELTIDQARPFGARRRIRLLGPALLTVHPAAPAPPRFVPATARSKSVARRQFVSSPSEQKPVPEYPYRRRPRLIRRVAGGGKVLVDATPEQAASEILAYLEQIGVLDRA